MDNKKTEKCAHLPCKCIPSDWREVLQSIL